MRCWAHSTSWTFQLEGQGGARGMSLWFLPLTLWHLSLGFYVEIQLFGPQVPDRESLHKSAILARLIQYIKMHCWLICFFTYFSEKSSAFPGGIHKKKKSYPEWNLVSIDEENPRTYFHIGWKWIYGCLYPPLQDHGSAPLAHLASLEKMPEMGCPWLAEKQNYLGSNRTKCLPLGWSPVKVGFWNFLSVSLVVGPPRWSHWICRCRKRRSL